MSELQFTTFGSVREVTSSTVHIPNDRREDFARAATYFSGRTNRHSLSVTMASEGEAKLLAKQIKQYADEHKLATAPKRNVQDGDGRTVTFRFAQPRDASKANGKVTVSQFLVAVSPNGGAHVMPTTESAETTPAAAN